MARWTQPHEIREFARVSHAFLDALSASVNVLVIDHHGRQHSGQLVASSIHQEPRNFPPAFAGEFTIEDGQGQRHTFDLLDVRDVYPLFTPVQAASQLPKEK